MDLEETRAAFRAANILLVEVEDIDDSPQSLRIAADLADYISVVKALHIPVVFIYLETLEMEDFIYLDGDAETDEEDESRRLDLCSINVELKRFKKHIGEIGSFTLYAAMQPKGLTYFNGNDWYAEFWKCRESATNSIDQGKVESQVNLDDEERKRLGEVTARLSELVNDTKFARLPTQKAMLAYAKLHIAGISEIDNATLKAAISDIAAHILAKGSK
jgi:hypothetical protein